MSAKGMVLAEEAHDVLAVAPIDINGGVTNSDVWSMAEAGHASILVAFGVTGAAVTITVEECDDFTPTNSTAIAFAYYAEETAGGDTLGTRQAATTAGITGSTNDGIFYRIEIDASQLTDGRPNLRVVLSDPSAATLATVVVTLTGIRYPQEESLTAIA